jgi:acyl transferase domain-containing protein/acyl carrier protein
MQDTAGMAAAIVGVGAILPDAPDVEAFWRNVREGRYSISEVTPDRWDPALYYDPDPRAPDKTYSKIGGWVRQWTWDPMGWRLPIPPKVSAVMDDAQKWAVACTRAALDDFGYPRRPLDDERTAVILGNAMAGEQHYLTSLRIFFPEFARELAAAPSFGALPAAVREAIVAETRDGVAAEIPGITEDTMPGELANCIAGRVANLNNFRGPNYVVDAACASAMAAMSAAVEGLTRGDFDAVVTGGIDRNMGAPTFVKFCKIGALSATGTRPYADGADGFVMGEGASVFLLKRLADAERDGDRVYAVVRSLAGSSDGKGKGITAPNPVGQRLAVRRAWRDAGEDPATVGLVEGHGTSTRVGDVVEVESLMAGLEGADLPPASVPLGSVKSNIGHLKGGAGGAGLLKAALALNDKVLPPSLNFDRPNPNIDFAASPFFVNTELRAWEAPAGGVRRAGVSAFGFGGTNFHAVLEEHAPGRLTGDGRRYAAGVDLPRPTATATAATAATPASATWAPAAAPALKRPLRGALVVGEASPDALNDRLVTIQEAAAAGRAPAPAAPTEAALRAAERVAIDYADAADLADKATKALRAASTDNPAAWKLMRAMGVFRGGGEAPKVAFLYTGQGSQYANMLAGLRASEPIVAETFAEADRIMEPLLGRPLSDFIFVDPDDPDAASRAEEALRQTAITQPAVLAADTALTRLLAAYGIGPDMVMGHSLGEYGALIAAGALPFADALEAVSARGREMTRVSVADNGRMAAVFAPLPEIERVLATVDGYVVVANLNSTGQAVVGGASDAVERAIAAFQAAGHQCVPLPVSHAFHTSIVAPASEPLRQALTRLRLAPPSLPIVANVSGELYPMGPGAVPEMLDILARQVASPVQFVKGLHTLYDAGVRVFVEVGPKRALQGFADDVFADRAGVVSLFTNHPKTGEVASFNQALCGLYAAGLGVGAADAGPAIRPSVVATPAPRPRSTEEAPMSVPAASAGSSADRYDEVGRMVADALERGFRMLAAERPAGTRPAEREATGQLPVANGEPVVITGAALGTPGTERIFDDANIGRLLRGEELIDLIPKRLRQAMVDKHITRLVKREDGDPTFETIDSQADVIKLAARGGAFDPAAEFGVSADRVPALDSDGAMAIAVGIDALRDAGIPLVLRYKTTSRNTRLPDRWSLPESLRDSTGVIFASAFPGLDGFADEVNRYHVDRARREQLEALESVRARLGDGGAAAHELERRIGELRERLAAEPYVFDRRFLFRCLSMGHAQFAEIVGARGPNTQINSACASTTQAVAMAEDWIRTGRCRRVVILAADDATSDRLMEWIGAGFLASGAAATDDDVEEAATPFDRRRHGMIIGMGAAALVVESAEAARERGVQPICEVLGAVSANSAFHGTRLDVDHISQVMEEVVGDAERRWGIRREEIAPRTVFVSHETYTPARGGSAAAEVHGLRRVFGEHADRIVVANTKGFTGHPMGVGIEDVAAVKSLETGLVPPVPNYREVDPELGRLNLSVGGSYPVDYALRLAAGFGSQLSLLLLRWVPTRDGVRRSPSELGFAYRVTDPAAFQAWLREASGRPDAELEVDHRRLRVKDRGAPAEPAQPARPEPAVAPAAQVAAPAPAPAAVAPAPAAPAPAAPAPAAQVAPPPMVDAPAAEPVAPPPTDDGDPVQARVLALVSQETGYPPDMLDLDLDLEADLGIDTVKQAEIFASIRESYGIERDTSLKLRDFPTLADVIRFVHERAPATAPPADQAPAPPAASAPAPASEAPPALTEAASPATDGDPVQAKVLALVSQETGYPPDMLDLDLDLEADLGVDTVKQAEIFASIRESYGIERDASLKLRDFPTLADVIRFVHERAPAAAGTGLAEAEPAAAAASRAGDLDAANQVPRRVPVPVLRPPLELCRPTGVTLGDGSRVLLMADRGGVAAALAGRLGKLGVEVLLVADAPDADALRERIDRWTADGPIHGVYWLPALDAEPAVADMDLGGWREHLRVRVKLLYAAMRALGGQVGGQGTFLVAGTRLGGRLGYDDRGATAPMGGAVSGFVKAFKRERPDALVKVVDLDPGRRTARPAELLVEETLRDPGAVEVGRDGDRRWTIAVAERPVADGQPGLALTPESVLVVTGAAGSIVSAIVADLAAAAGGGTFHLLDLAPEPDPGDEDTRRFAGDRDGLKRDLAERMRAAGERPTPALIERQLAGIERRAAALAAVEAVRAAGGTARYHSLDLTDAAAVAAAVDEVRQRHGRVDALVHAAGLEISRLLPDKEPREFDLVFDVKSDGWFNLLHALGDLPVGATVAFSSIAGRFGNAGQTDYSAANDLLCKSASALRRTRPQTRAIAIDWTAWAGIGMASRGSIPKMMELAGIDMLPPQAGVPTVRRELVAGGRGEVLVGGRLGVLADEWDPTGGLDTDAADALATGPMVGHVAGMGVHQGIVASTTLDPTAQPFLDHHRIDGTAVLPGVMGVEGFAELAALPLPGWRVAAIQDVRFLAAVKFYRDEPRTLTLQARLGPDGDDVVADCRLTSVRRLANQEEQATTHFTGRVRLTATPSEAAPAVAAPAPPAGATVEREQLYRIYFHGPAYKVVERAWRDGDHTVGLLPAELPPNHEPATAPLVMAPRLVELCFQAAGVHQLGTSGQMALPERVGRIAVLRDPQAAGGRLLAVVTTHADGTADADVVDEAGQVYVRVDGYGTVALPVGPEAELLQPLEAAMA